MTTDDIISCLQVADGILATYAKRAKYANQYHPAMVVAIDAVRLLEKVKDEAEGVCELCRYGKSDENKPPCNTCLPRYFATGIAPLWEWFNGEFADATQEENEDEQAND